MLQYGALDVSIYQIQLFLAVAEECNFSRTADIMHIAQPTLSKRVKSMEQMIGIELFDRSKRPLELTPAGVSLYNQLKPLAAKIEAILNTTHKEYGMNKNRLAVGIPDSGKDLTIFHKAGKYLQSEAEGFTFTWQYIPIAKWRDMLINKNLDIMFTPRLEEPAFEDCWEWERIMEVPKLVCMLKTNPLADKDVIAYDDLRSQRFVMNSVISFPLYSRLVREMILEHGGFEPEIARYASTPHNLIASIENDDEVVICDMYIRGVDSELIKCFELPDTKSGLDAIWRKDNKNPYIRRYLDLSRQLIAEQYPGTVCRPH